MRTPTAVSYGGQRRLVRCLSLRSLAGLGRLVALLLGEAAPDAVDLPGPQRERETLGSGPGSARLPARPPGSCHSPPPPVTKSAGRAAAACRRIRSAPAGRRRRPAGSARAPARPSAAAARPGTDGTAARPARGSHARSASRRRPRSGRPLHTVAHHEFLLIWPTQRSSLPGGMSFSVTTRSTGPGSLRGG